MRSSHSHRLETALALGLLVASALPSSVLAQDPPRRPPQDRAEMEQRVRAQMQRVVKERLQLTDAQSEELSEVARGFEDRRRSLARSGDYGGARGGAGAARSA